MNRKIKNGSFHWILLELKSRHNFLDKREKIRAVLLLTLLVLSNLLDLLGVMLIGVMTSLTLTGFSNGNQGDRVARLIELIGLEPYTITTQITILASITLVSFVSKTIFSLWIFLKLLSLTATVSARLADKVTRLFVGFQGIDIQKQSVQDTIYSLTSGATALGNGVILNFVRLVADASLLVLMVVGLAILDPVVTLCLILFLMTIIFLVDKKIRLSQLALGRSVVQDIVGIQKKIYDLVNVYREAYVRGFVEVQLDAIKGQQFSFAQKEAKLTFLGATSKYVFEIVMILILSLLAFFQAVSADASRAIATTAVFAAAATRLLPSIIRAHQSLVGIRQGIITSEPALKVLTSDDPGLKVLKVHSEHSEENTPEQPAKLPNRSTLRIENVTFSFKSQNKEVLRSINIVGKLGDFILISGPSGSGKSTLVDLILGLREPAIGTIEVLGLSPREAIRQHPLAIGFVSQNYSFFHGSIRENLLLGLEKNEFSDEEVINALIEANIWERIRQLPEGLNHKLGNVDSELSGGERQRIAIARALVSNPTLLIFDEATNALDDETESNILKNIRNNSLARTIVWISHKGTANRYATKEIIISKSLENNPV